jgi:hypothetical protein
MTTSLLHFLVVTPLAIRNVDKAGIRAGEDLLISADGLTSAMAHSQD